MTKSHGISIRIKAFFRKPINLFYLVSLAGIVGFFICASSARRDAFSLAYDAGKGQAGADRLLPPHRF